MSQEMGSHPTGFAGTWTLGSRLQSREGSGPMVCGPLSVVPIRAPRAIQGMHVKAHPVLRVHGGDQPAQTTRSGVVRVQSGSCCSLWNLFGRPPALPRHLLAILCLP